ncbi:MAG: hypothetical protein WC516_00275 [Patescibacteria group bacterium]
MEKLNNLPEAVKSQLSSPAFLTVLSNLEQIYSIKPALMMIRLVVGDLTVDALPAELQQENPSLFPQQIVSIQKSFVELLSKLPPVVPASTSAYSPSVFPQATPTPVVPSRPAPPLSSIASRNPQPSVMARTASPVSSGVSPSVGLVFSTDDEEEIKKYASAAGQPTMSIDYAKQADVIIAKLGYNNKDGDLNKRLQNVVVSSVRGIRDALETREILLKSKETGGLGFDQATAEKLLQLIAGQNQPTASGSVVAGQESSFIPPIPVAPKASARISEVRPSPTTSAGTGPIIKEENGLPVVIMPEELMVKPELLGGAKKSAPSPKTESIKPTIPGNYLSGKHLPGTTTYQTIKRGEVLSSNNQPTAPKPEPYLATSRPATAKFFNQSASRRPTLDDVKFTKKLIGPIEELENMTLIDFRRLGVRPEDIISKIKEKIDLLEKEHYGKRLQGIAAWYKNEVNRFYRLLGHSSMETGKTIKEVIDERIGAGKPTLSLAEFEAVMELNRDLRY